VSTKVTYRDHTITLVSTYDPETKKWSPKATVMFIGSTETITHQVQPSGLFDTQAAADDHALEEAKDWINQRPR
jgi:hypothetical protein